jgi:hypothetical protein
MGSGDVSSTLNLFKLCAWAGIKAKKVYEPLLIVEMKRFSVIWKNCKTANLIMTLLPAFQDSKEDAFHGPTAPDFLHRLKQSASAPVPLEG